MVRPARTLPLTVYGQRHRGATSSLASLPQAGRPPRSRRPIPDTRGPKPYDGNLRRLLVPAPNRTDQTHKASAEERDRSGLRHRRVGDVRADRRVRRTPAGGVDAGRKAEEPKLGRRVEA